MLLLVLLAFRLALLYVMQIDPAIAIGNAEAEIDKVRPRLMAQEAHLKEKFGSGTWDLAWHILASQGHIQEATVMYNNNEKLDIWRARERGSEGYNRYIDTGGRGFTAHWKLIPVDCNLDTVDTTTEYRFRLVYMDGDYELGWFWGFRGSSPELERSGAGPAETNGADAFVLVAAAADYVHLLYKKRNDSGKDVITYLYRSSNRSGSAYSYRTTSDTDTSNENFAIRAV